MLLIFESPSTTDANVALKPAQPAHYLGVSFINYANQASNSIFADMDNEFSELSEYNWLN